MIPLSADPLILTALAAALAYGLIWAAREAVPLLGGMVKAASTGLLAVAGVVMLPSAGGWVVALGLALGALGDFALTRRGAAWFLAGMAAFAAGHLAYVAGFVLRSQSIGFEAVSGSDIAAMGALLALLLSTELWLAPRTGALRWPVRGYVVVIGAMALAAVLLPAHPGQEVIRAGAGLFVLSDLLLALRLFVVQDAALQRLLSLLLWPAYWLGQMLILLGAQAYWAYLPG